MLNVALERPTGLQFVGIAVAPDLPKILLQPLDVFSQSAFKAMAKG